MIRPKERLLRKRIPKEAIREELEKWSNRLGHWDEFFTAVVVLGLLTEYFPDITYFLPLIVAGFVSAYHEQLHQFGGFLVVLGVAGELWIGFKESRIETDLREENNSTITTTLERAATAEKTAAEANLARLRIEERIAELSSPRRLTEEQFEAFKNLLLPFSGTRVDLFVFDGHLIEASFFAEQLRKLFSAAGWKPRMWNCTGALRLSGASLSMAVRSDQFVSEGPIPRIQWIMVSLCGEFFKLRIECTSLSGGFDPHRTFSPWEMKENDSWSLEDIAPLRIQVSAKQHMSLMDQIGDLRTITASKL